MERRRSVHSPIRFRIPDAVDVRRPATGSGRSHEADSPGRASLRAGTSERVDEPDTADGVAKSVPKEPLTEAVVGVPGTAHAQEEAASSRRTTEPDCSTAADNIQARRKLLNGYCCVVVVVAAAAAAVVVAAAERRMSYRTGVYSELSSSGTTSCWHASPALLYHCKYPVINELSHHPRVLLGLFFLKDCWWSLPQDLISADDDRLLTRI